MGTQAAGVDFLLMAKKNTASSSTTTNNINKKNSNKTIAQTLKQVPRQAAPPLPRHRRELRQEPLEVHLRCFRQELGGRKGDDKGMM